MDLPALAVSAFAPRVRGVFCVALICISAIASLAQGDYTKDMPSVERVKTEIKGTDPADTVARQVAVMEDVVMVVPWLPRAVPDLDETDPPFDQPSRDE